MTDRGQTIHDYLLGVVLVLLTILGVFTFFPDVFTPFEEPVQNNEENMAEELATEVVEANQTMRGSRTVNYTALGETLNSDDRVSTLANRSGIPRWKQLNITVINQTDVVATTATSGRGSEYREQTVAATITRTIESPVEPECRDSCQVIVRVWGG